MEGYYISQRKKTTKVYHKKDIDARVEIIWIEDYSMDAMRADDFSTDNTITLNYFPKFGPSESKTRLIKSGIAKEQFDDICARAEHEEWDDIFAYFSGWPVTFRKEYKEEKVEPTLDEKIKYFQEIAEKMHYICVNIKCSDCPWHYDGKECAAISKASWTADNIKKMIT